MESPQADQKTSNGAPRKRVIFGVIGGIAAIFLVIFGLKWYAYASVHEGTDDARVDADAVAITSKINERIDHILVTTNQAVHKGQLLVVLDDADEKARLAQAQANFDFAVANRQTQVEQSQGGVAQASADVAGSQAQVAATQAQVAVASAEIPAAQQAYDKAAADLHRTQSLVATGDVASSQLDAARAGAAAAYAQLAAARQQVGVADANVSAAAQRVGGAQGGVMTANGKLAASANDSQVQAAEAALKQAKLAFSYTHIVSPINGYVGEKSAEQGQTVGAGMTLMTLIPSSNIYITANFKETQLTDMKPGQPVDIKVDAYPSVTFHGTLVSINPASQNTYALVPSQNATGNFVKVTQRVPVRISIDNPPADMPLRPGMSVETYVKIK